ncbi:MAG: Hsp20/alpha crystallin family protein [Betaproteobacteria bacterium]|nr:Hsp20/alpha crystallin family protein [Betaproteobacteria bacterium]MBU6511508.1 Hsp20/alpha crystallin family protein [Betaproteobacteria bacterium]MDE1954383.1 Hsp20/alpha crystallin family protein [Betaproteobacteria bacterium]MDE2151084.1 Hsp20/alpha crystallin family protein [Betaproteobacteria bacterium]MDE2478277.1 Hsp20/alpha crystallin family protein [Betaproteobacteria bacterium]
MNTTNTQIAAPSAAPQAAAAGSGARATPSQAPRVDIFEDAEGITLRADMPGVPREQLQVQVDGDTLTLRGQVRIELAQGMQPFYAELRSSAWERSFTLSRELDSAAIQASMKDGVLELRIPKAEHAKPRRVEVKLN